MKAADNTISSIKKYFNDRLADNFELNEINTFFTWCAQEFLGLSKIEVGLNKDQRLSESEILKFHFATKQLLQNEPIQYILGNTWFYNLQFDVNSDVLIPRPETEELVDWILTEEKSGSLLDIGTGSGCIAISLANANSNFKVSAYDISEGALHVAKRNAIKNEVKVDFKLVDILTEEINGKFDIIVSNPPYIPNSDKSLMHKNVLEFEPGLALFVENHEPIIFYQTIAKKSLVALTKNGKIYFEIHEDYGNEVAEMLKQLGYSDIIIKKDLQGKNRMIRATLAN
jgi:release factor glutamine methyltransferase